MKLKLIKLHRSNSVILLRWKVKQDEGVKYLPNNLYDGFKVDRDKRSIPAREAGRHPGIARLAPRPSKF